MDIVTPWVLNTINNVLIKGCRTNLSCCNLMKVIGFQLIITQHSKCLYLFNYFNKLFFEYEFVLKFR